MWDNDSVKGVLAPRVGWLVIATICSIVIGLRAEGQTGSASSETKRPGGTLQGSVSDWSNQPLTGAEVTIVAMGLSTRTDSAGAFAFQNVPAGSYRVEARRLGYQPMAHAATIAGASDAKIAFTLPPAAQLLDAKEITGKRDIMPPDAPQRMFDFYRRRKTGMGIYVTRDQIERAGSVRATLGGVSGIRLSTAPGGQLRGIEFVRCSGSLRDRASPVAYFLDGRQTTEGGLSFLSDVDIEALEIYKGPASMPPEAVGNACAAVFIWTRR